MDPLKALLTKYRRKLITPLTIVLALICTINFYFIFEVTPQPNDECIWEPQKVSRDSLGYFFSDVKFEGVTWDAGIRDGDQLLEIENIPIKNTSIATYIISKISSGDSANYKIVRDGRVFETKVEIKKLINFGGLGITLLASLWLFVGFIVLRANHDGYIQILFYRNGILLVLMSVSIMLNSQNNFNPVLQYPFLVFIIEQIYSFGAIYFPFYLVYFFWHFPKPFKLLENTWTKKVLYFIPTIIFSGMVAVKIFLVYVGNTISPSYFFPIYSGGLNFLILFGLVIGLISLFRNYLRLENKRERNAIFIILIGYTVGMASLVYTVTMSFVGGIIIYNSPEYYMPIILIALLPVAFGYSIFKYSLMDVSVVVKNTLMYGFATITLAGIYFTLIYLLGQGISQALSTDYQGVIAGGIFIVFALVFQSTKDRFQDLITEKFYPDQFAFKKVILSFGKDITSIVGKDNILDFVQDTFVNSLAVEKFAILTTSRDGKTIDLQRGVGVSEFSLNHTKNDLLLKQHFENKRLVKQLPLIDELDFESLFPIDYELLRDEGFYTIVPLMVKGEVTGLLLFGLKQSRLKLSEKDIELVTAASNHISISLENARLYETEADKLKLERDLENARIIQESLLPRDIPDIKGLDVSGAMIPAMQVGGDYYDVIKVSDKKLYVVVGDVSGKGLSASLYMTKLQTIMRLYCNEHVNPREIIINLNKEMYEAMEKNWFITLSVALFDLETRTVKLCRAGHPPTMVINNSSVDLIHSKGIGVGIEAGEIFDTTLEEVERSIQLDDLFIFYSDGITEAMNSDLELFGDDRLIESASSNVFATSDKIKSEILTSIYSFRKDFPANDDITLICLKVTK